MSGRTGRAAVVREYHEPLEFVEYPVPEPEPGALVVHIETATVCGSDVHVWEGKYEGVQPVERPLIIGHESAGRVVAIGAGADRDSLGQQIAIGDRVISTHASCGACWACTVERQPTLCSNRTIGMLTTSARPPHFNGTFAQYGYVRPKAGRVRVPDDVPSDLASAASCALRTVIGAIERAGRIDALHNVVIQGAGPVGLFMTAVLATGGPRRIIVIGAPDQRLEVARQWGATDTVSLDEYPDAADRERVIRDLTDGRGGDVVFEAAGVGKVFEEGIELVAANGRYVIVGSVTGIPQTILPHRIVNRGLTIIGSYGGDTGAYFRALEFLRAHSTTFDWSLLLGRRYGLDEVTDALRSLKAGADLKPVIDPWSDA